MRVAFFGGTFDPPHLGHAAIARAAADRFGLEEVLWAPAGRQPLKRDRPLTPYAERLRMVELACAVDPRFRPSALDAPRPDGEPNYTVDTLRRLRAERQDDALFALAGADSFADLAHWREPRALLALAEWIVVSRPGAALCQPAGLALSEADRRRIHLLDTVQVDVSATELRGDLRRDEPVGALLAPAVRDYIQMQGLYRPNKTAANA